MLFQMLLKYGAQLLSIDFGIYGGDSQMVKTSSTAVENSSHSSQTYSTGSQIEKGLICSLLLTNIRINNL